eukprot:TRINITY_DN5928_c0_g1_i1.p4 TRINITY_DN5928_c0_g1~~TRINITY_DN5928_c0_g1_i1.p4  ORF type:complete len:179 (-),score=8.34 TRINITY_DN5928_c0_g1_i1:303-839(-)
MQLVFKKPDKITNAKIEVYSDASYADCQISRKSTSGYVVHINQNIVSWASNKQKTVALSTTEAEYVGLTNAVQELMFILQLCRDLHWKMEQKPKLFGDNLSSIALVQHNQTSGRTKHIDTKLHFIKEKIQDGLFELEYCASCNNISDIFTKQLPIYKHYSLIRQLCLQDTKDEDDSQK